MSEKISEERDFFLRQRQAKDSAVEDKTVLVKNKKLEQNTNQLDDALNQFLGLHWLLESDSDDLALERVKMNAAMHLSNILEVMKDVIGREEKSIEYQETRVEEQPAVVRVMEGNYSQVESLLTNMEKRIRRAKKKQNARPRQIATTVFARLGSDDSELDDDSSNETSDEYEEQNDDVRTMYDGSESRSDDNQSEESSSRKLSEFTDLEEPDY